MTGVRLWKDTQQAMGMCICEQRAKTALELPRQRHIWEESPWHNPLSNALSKGAGANFVQCIQYHYVSKQLQGCWGQPFQLVDERLFCILKYGLSGGGFLMMHDIHFCIGGVGIRQPDAIQIQRLILGTTHKPNMDHLQEILNTQKNPPRHLPTTHANTPS